MTTLHISHTVLDVREWLRTFESFSQLRAQGGVTGLTIRHGVDDPDFVAVDLEFGTTAEAQAFRERLENEVWPSSPHLTGTPTTHVLEPIGTGA